MQVDDYSGAGWLLFDALAGIPTLFIYVGIYLLVSFASLALFRKLGIASWKAWVPVVREWEMFRLSGMTPWWAVILPVSGVILGVLCAILVILVVVIAVERGFSGSPGEAFLWGFGGIAVIGAIVIAWGVFALVVVVKMMNRVNRGFGESLALTFLGVVFYPAWLAVLGWGQAEWQGATISGGRPVSAPTSRLVFPDGSQVDLRSRRVVVGTSQVSDGLPSGTQLVTVQDPSGSVAPFHAQFDRSGDHWRVTDLNTVTGTFVVDASGTLYRISQPVTGVTVLVLGHVRVEVR